MHVVADEGDVEEEGEELAGDEEKRVEEDVEDVLGQHERVEAVALVDRVLVVRLQLVECCNRQFLVTLLYRRWLYKRFRVTNGKSFHL